MRYLLPALLCAALLLPAYASEEREYIYGAELMTPKERTAYRRDLQKMTGDEARGGYRHKHRERLQKRARQRGMELDERGIVRRPRTAR